MQGAAKRLTAASFRAPPSWRCQPAHQPAVVQRQQRRSLSGRAAPVNVQCWLRAPEKAWHAQRTTADGRQPAVCVESSLTLRCVSRRTSSAALPAPPAGCCRDKGTAARNNSCWMHQQSSRCTSVQRQRLLGGVAGCADFVPTCDKCSPAICQCLGPHRGQAQRLLNAALGSVPGAGHSVGEGVPPVSSKLKNRTDALIAHHGCLSRNASTGRAAKASLLGLMASESCSADHLAQHVTTQPVALTSPRQQRPRHTPHASAGLAGAMQQACWAPRMQMQKVPAMPACCAANACTA